MRQLSELDASFLYLENERTPLYVGGVYVFERPENAQTETATLNFDRFKALIHSKLGNEPFFRQRLVEYPLNLDLPIWADDPDFELDNHLEYESLKLSEYSSLLETASEFFHADLDRSKPLWKARFIDSLETDPSGQYHKEHFALFLKVHIAAIDNSTGEDILSQLLNVTPDFTKLADAYPWTPQPLPDTGSWLGAAYNNVFAIPAKLTGLAKDTAASAFHSLLNERMSSLNMPAGLLKVAKTPINQKITASRELENIEIPLEDIRSIKRQIQNVTTNDVVMGICAEAIASYLKDADVTLKDDLIALAPIAVRSTSLDVKSGNQLAATLFSLASTEPDPVKRILHIHNAATSSNSYDAAISASRLTELVPSCTASLSARVYSEFLLAQKHKPMFNLPIINIPGPQFPLYFEDSELVKFMSTSPLFDGIGLSLMIVSYNGAYSITATYNPDTLSLKRPFTQYIRDALHDIKSYDYASLETFKIEEDASSTGVIDDVVGLVNNLFSLGK